VAEIQKAAKKDPALAAAGAVLFLEKVSPALEQVDSSSGAIGTAVNHAIEACAKIIAAAPVDDETRDRWLDRLWEAHQNDEIPYVERLGDYWGELCASPERSSAWADRLMGTVEMVWSPSRKPGGYFHGTVACLSALFHAGRHEELLALLERAPYPMWHYREWGVKALAAMGRKAEAIRYAEASRGLNDNPIAIARLRGDSALFRIRRGGVCAVRHRGQSGDDVPRDLPVDREEVPHEGAREDPWRSGGEHARSGRQVVRRGQGCRATTRP
jgi:tetratricopeptide (TPR) repeat protein